MKKFVAVAILLCLLLSLCGCNYQHTHIYLEEKIAPTCTKEGYSVYTCDTCGYKVWADYVPPLAEGGHTYVDYVCVECDDFLKEEAVVTPTLHYSQIKDDNGNDAYELTAIMSDDVYAKISSTYNGLPVTNIASRAFYNNLNLKHVVLPDSIVYIGYEAFKHCFNLLTINIPDSVTEIGEEAFSNCSKLQSITLGSVTTVKEFTFLGCGGLTSIVIPNSVTTIEEGAFYGCRGLESVVIADSVTTIEVQAFAKCHKLKSVTIPTSVTTFELDLFEENYELTDIYYKGTIEQWKAILQFTDPIDTVTRDHSWDAYTGEYTVHCVDGDLTKSEARNNYRVNG